jgi:hypothetical protein
MSDKQTIEDGHWPLVLVRWQDATTFYGWRPLDETLTMEPKEIETVGTLVRDDEKYIVITQSVSAPVPGEPEDAFQFADPFVIPKQWCLEVKVLGIAGDYEMS